MKTISFDAISIEAIRAGKKTMTRRPMINIVQPRWAVGDEAWVKTSWVDDTGKSHPARFMRRINSPFSIRITGHRIERLQAITPEDVEREGIDVVSNLPMVPSIHSANKSIEHIAQYLFHDRWAGIYEVRKPRSYRFWDFNPWVEVLTFEIISNA